jgi:DNA invertase Pin-like site-specific DNA recombinase
LRQSTKVQWVKGNASAHFLHEPGGFFVTSARLGATLLMANILAGVAVYETEVRAERILAGQAAARERGVRWGGSIRGRRIRATAEQITVIRRMTSAGGEIAAIARATGLSRPTI